MEERLNEYMQKFALCCSDTKIIKCKKDDLQMLRTNIEKVNSLLTSNKKCRKTFLSHGLYIDYLAFALQFLNDKVLRTQITLILFKLVGKSGCKSRIALLIQKGITRALFQAVYMEFSEETPDNELLLKMHELLCRFGPMDKRFGIRARVSHCIPVTINLLRIQVALLKSFISSHCTVTYSTSPITEFYKHLKNLSNLHLYSSFIQNIIKQDMMLNIQSTMPTISSVIHHNLIIILHMICLYVSDGGKSNSYLLGRSGVVKLVIVLIALLSGLHVYKTYSSDINSPLLSSSSSSMKTTAVNPLKIIKTLMNENTNYVGNNSQLSLSSSSSASTMKMNNNNLNSNQSSINRLSNVHDNKSTVSSNGSSSPVITIITGLTLATIYLQRLYQEETKKVSFHNNNNSNTNNNKSTNMIYTTDLSNLAISLITTKPTLIAVGVKCNGNLLCLLVNTLNSLIKYKNNAKRANNNGAVPLLLDLFLDIHRCDLQWNWIDLQKRLLNCLKHLTAISSGRKALIRSGGLHSLFAVCAGYVGPDPLRRTKYTLLQMISQHKNLKSYLPYHQELLLNSTVSQHNRSHTVTTTEMTTSIDTVNMTPLSSLNKKLHSKNVNINFNKTSSFTSLNRNTSVCIAANNETVPNLHEICIPATKLSPSTVFHKIDGREANTLLNDDLCITDSNQLVDIHKRYKHSDPINILIQAFVLLRRCCPRCHLPVDHAEGILGCRLPKDSSFALSLRRNTEPAIQSYEILQPYNKCSSISSTSTTATPTTTTTTLSTSIDNDDVIKLCINRKQQMSNNDSIFNKLYITLSDPVLLQDNPLIMFNKYNNSKKSTLNKPKNMKSFIKLHHTNYHVNSLIKTKSFSNKLSRNTNSDSKHYYNKSMAGLNTYSHVNDASISPCLYSTSSKHFDSSLFTSQSCTELTNMKSVNNSNRIHKENALESRIDVVRLNRKQRRQQHDFSSSTQRKLLIHSNKSALHHLPNSSSASLSPPKILNINERNVDNDNGDSDNNQDESGEDDSDEQVDDDENCVDEDNIDTDNDNNVSTVNQYTFDELITSHLKFFPEWFDLPNEIPNRLIKEQIVKPSDMDSVNWPYELSTYEYSIVNSMETNATIRKTNTLTKSTIDEYLYFTNKVQSLLPFQMISYADLVNSNEFYNEYEPFNTTNEFIQRYFNQQLNTVNTSLNSCSFNEKLFQFESTSHDLIDDDNNNKTKKSIHLSRYHNTNCNLIKSTSEIQHTFNSYKPIELNSKTMNTLLTNHQSSYLSCDISNFPHLEILDDIRRFINSNDVINRVVFDLDELLMNEFKEYQSNNQHNSSLSSSSLKQQSHDLQHSSNVNLKCSIGEFIDDIPITSSYKTISSFFNQMNDHMKFKGLFNTTQSRNSNHLQNNLNSSLYSSLMNNCRLFHQDELLINQLDTDKGHLDFESRFECGNLRKAIQVRQYEYDLILNPDVNTTSNIQWFYFRVSNMEANVSYRFNIINCEKIDSQFNAGMQPLLFSVREALDSRPYWRRVGSNIIYYKNHFIRQMTRKNNVDCGMYYTATFTICFPYAGDVCYLSYHYPYTYTHLLTDLNKWHKQTLNNSNNIYFRIQQLTSTILCNPIPLITITQLLDNSDKYNNINQRPYIVLTCRVHPGESNSSWVMKGLLEKLLSTDDIKMVELRKMFIFKIIPMLNPDGVIVGNHRCSMSGKDLNRHWINPSPLIHPTIYHSKMLIQLLAICERSPYIFIDFHGHSRMKNIFLYGCSSNESWLHPDVQNPAYRDGKPSEDISYRILPELLHKLSPYFSKQSCLYMISKAKESTARIAVWRQFNVLRSYTIEASYCGIYNIWRGDQLIKSQKQQREEESNNRTKMEQQKISKPIIIEHQIRPIDLMEFGSHLLNAFALLPKEETVAISSINNTVSSLSSSTNSSTTTISNRSYLELLSPLSPDLNTDTKITFHFDDTDDNGTDDSGDDNNGEGGECDSDGDENEEADVKVNANYTNVNDETLRLSTLSN